MTDLRPVLDSKRTRSEYTNGQTLGALSVAKSFELIDASPPAWIVDGILATDDYGALVGAKGTGKTWALLDMAVSVALGEPWLGRFHTIEGQGQALVLTAEDGRAKVLRRIAAICASKGRELGEIEDQLWVHPEGFSVVNDLPKLRAELSLFHEPAFVMLDPAYKYMSGANPRDLFNMGSILTPLQKVCRDVGAALMVGHHTNRREGASREERVSGAGVLEWSRVLATLDNRKPAEEMLVSRLVITGNSLSEMGYTLHRSMQALDGSANPELSYYAEVVSEGAEPREEPWTAARRVLATLPTDPVDGLLVAEIQEGTVDDESGLSPLKMETVRYALKTLRDEGLADSDSEGPGKAGRWWKV